MIDEFVSLFQPLVTFLMLGLLGYFVHGYLVRERRYNKYPESCKTTYKPRRITEDKHIFEDEDPWLQTFESPKMKTTPDAQHSGYDTSVGNMHGEDNHVGGKK